MHTNVSVFVFPSGQQNSEVLSETLEKEVKAKKNETDDAKYDWAGEIDALEKSHCCQTKRKLHAQN